MKVYVSGHKGLVGSALVRALEAKKYSTVLTKERSQLDLTDRDQVFDFFNENKPDHVYLAAAKVGGIYANNTYPVEFLLNNLKIQNNVIEAAYKNGVKKLLFLGSSCVYPKNAPQPISEDALLSSKLEPTNEAYALAKIAGIKLCHSFNRQYGTDYLCVMPSNVYGPNDNFHKEDAHVIPMLMRRFHEAKLNNDSTVSVWGTGKVRREFLFSDDLADACVYLMENKSSKEVGELINIGLGHDYAISELAQMIKETVGLKAELIYDSSKPDGTSRKLLDVSKAKSLGWEAKTKLQEGLKTTYSDFLKNPNTRL